MIENRTERFSEQALLARALAYVERVARTLSGLGTDSLNAITRTLNEPRMNAERHKPRSPEPQRTGPDPAALIGPELTPQIIADIEAVAGTLRAGNPTMTGQLQPPEITSALERLNQLGKRGHVTQCMVDRLNSALKSQGVERSMASTDIQGQLCIIQCPTDPSKMLTPEFLQQSDSAIHTVIRGLQDLDRWAQTPIVASKKPDRSEENPIRRGLEDLDGLANGDAYLRQFLIDRLTAALKTAGRREYATLVAGRWINVCSPSKHPSEKIPPAPIEFPEQVRPYFQPINRDGYTVGFRFGDHEWMFSKVDVNVGRDFLQGLKETSPQGHRLPDAWIVARSVTVTEKNGKYEVHVEGCVKDDIEGRRGGPPTMVVTILDPRRHLASMHFEGGTTNYFNSKEAERFFESAQRMRSESLGRMKPGQR